MTFSRRFGPHLAENRIARRLAELERAGRPVLDLTGTNPTRAELAYPAAEIREALAAADVLDYEPEPLGLLRAREALARRAHWDPARILLTASTSEAYAYLFKLLCDPGDEVLVPHPSYPLFEHLTALELVRAVPYRLAWDGTWHVDLGSVRAAISPRTRAVLVVSPANPTGNYLKREELASLAAICRERGLSLICDEVFSDFPVRDVWDRAPAPLWAEGVLTFALSGLSKVVALPQLKLAWMLAAGPPVLLEPALDRLALVADTFLSPATHTQRALPALLALAPRIQGVVLARLRQNLAALRAARQPGAPWDVLEVEGGWSAVLRVPRTRSEEEWVLALLDDGVRVHPGWFFDFPREGFLVLSLLPEPGAFAEGVHRLAARLAAQ